MVIAFVSNDRKLTVLALGALLWSSLSLAGCVTSNGSSLMDARAEAPAPPQIIAYPSLEKLPPGRGEHAMMPDERLKLSQELLAVRDRQAATGNAQKRLAPPNQ
jgi:hypothetical protein